jgi:hypothetical protein
MPLQGSLKDFGIVELLQLLAAQEKTGTLRISGESGRQSLLFEAGQIVSTWDPQVSNRDPFREFLLRREIVPRDELARILKTEVTSPHSFGEMLLRLRALTPEEVQDAFTDHVQEKVDDLLRLRAGSFEFIQQERVAPCAPAVCVHTEGLLMEAARRVDEVGTTRVRMDSILDRRTGKDHEEGTAEPLSPSAERLFGLVDGRVPLSEIARRNKIPQGDALAAAAELIRGGHAALREVIPPEEVERAVGARTLPAFVHFLFMGIVLGLALLGFQAFAPRPLADPPTDPVQILASRVRSIARDRDLAALRAALEFFRQQHGRYPGQLEALVSDGMIDRAALQTVSDLEYIYYPVQGGIGYRLEDRKESKIVSRTKPAP